MKRSIQEEPEAFKPSNRVETTLGTVKQSEDESTELGMPLSTWLKFLDSVYSSLVSARPQITSNLLIQTIQLNLGG
jgi:hypothetical protein